MPVTITKSMPRKVGRPADRKDEIVRALRDGIVSGQFERGSRMPTREQIVQQFSANAMTVNSALTELREAGFVTVRGTQGTFVSEVLPHLTRYAVAFPMPEAEIRGGGYTAALARECGNLDPKRFGNREIEILPFYDLGRGWDAPDFVRLMSEVRGHRIAGIVSAFNSSVVLEAEDLLNTKVPIVAIGALPAGSSHSSIFFDDTKGGDEALRYLAARGVKRPALLISVTSDRSLSHAWMERVKAHGMIADSYLAQIVHLGAPDAARHIAKLLMVVRHEHRPDGLIINDDNLAPTATQGLIEAGITAESGFPIAAHANFPWPTQCHLPALRFGHDVRELIGRSIRIIDQMRLDNKPQRLIFDSIANDDAPTTA